MEHWHGWQLWIDFKLCSYFWFDNLVVRCPLIFCVVNWFQIMFLFLVRQPINTSIDSTGCCELISNYVLIFGSTTLQKHRKDISLLWIDFKLCSYFWFDNPLTEEILLKCVVNWFQIMFLFLVRQLYVLPITNNLSCELISNYVLIFGSTTGVNSDKAK